MGRIFQADKDFAIQALEAAPETYISPIWMMRIQLSRLKRL